MLLHLIILLIYPFISCSSPASTQQHSSMANPITDQFHWSATGIRMTLPQGWQGVLDPNGLGLVLSESATGSSTILVYPDVKMPEDAAREMSQPFQIGQIMLNPVGQPAQGPQYIANWFESTDGIYATVVYRTGTQGIHASLLAISQTSRELDNLLLEIINSMDFDSPAPSTYASHLTGLTIRKQSNSTNYDEYDEISLCSDGSYSRVFALNSSGSGTLTTKSNGFWKILSSTLFLYDPERGESATLSLDQDGGFHMVGQAHCS